MKVRLTFKSFTQELWISSVSNTQKLPYSSIRNVLYEPIKGKEEYHIVVAKILYIIFLIILLTKNYFFFN